MPDTYTKREDSNPCRYGHNYVEYGRYTRDGEATGYWKGECRCSSNSRMSDAEYLNSSSPDCNCLTWVSTGHEKITVIKYRCSRGGCGATTESSD